MEKLKPKDLELYGFERMPDISVKQKIKKSSKWMLGDVIYDSSLEVRAHIHMKNAGLEFIYNPPSIQLAEAFLSHPQTIYLPRKRKGSKVASIFVRKSDKNDNMVYTPDFLVTLPNNKFVYIETKGFANDAFPIRRKMFFNKLKDMGSNYYYIQAGNEDNVLEMIEIIKTLSKDE